MAEQPDELTAALAAVQRAAMELTAAETVTKRKRAARNARVLEAIEAGAGPTEAARAAGISYQGVVDIRKGTRQ